MMIVILADTIMCIINKKEFMIRFKDFIIMCRLLTQFLRSRQQDNTFGLVAA